MRNFRQGNELNAFGGVVITAANRTDITEIIHLKVPRSCRLASTASIYFEPDDSPNDNGIRDTYADTFSQTCTDKYQH